MEPIIRISRLVQVIMFPNVCGPRQNRKTLFSAPKRRGFARRMRAHPNARCVRWAYIRTPPANVNPDPAHRHRVLTFPTTWVGFGFAVGPDALGDAQMRFEVLQLARFFDSRTLLNRGPRRTALRGPAPLGPSPKCPPRPSSLADSFSERFDCNLLGNGCCAGASGAVK